MKKEFDWDYFKTLRSKEVYEYVKSVWDKPITEDEFVEGISKLPRDRKPYASKTRRPSTVRNYYRKLKEKFGFFNPTH